MRAATEGRLSPAAIIRRACPHELPLPELLILHEIIRAVISLMWEERSDLFSHVFATAAAVANMTFTKFVLAERGEF